MDNSTNLQDMSVYQVVTLNVVIVDHLMSNCDQPAELHTYIGIGRGYQCSHPLGSNM